MYNFYGRREYIVWVIPPNSQTMGCKSLSPPGQTRPEAAPCMLGIRTTPTVDDSPERAPQEQGEKRKKTRRRAPRAAAGAERKSSGEHRACARAATSGASDLPNHTDAAASSGIMFGSFIIIVFSRAQKDRPIDERLIN